MKIKKLQVKIELTKKCNLSCKHCSSKAGLVSNTEINPKHIDRILLDSSAIERVVLTGGEPFSCSHFSETLEKFNKAGFLPSIYTSGNFDKSPTILGSLTGRISQLIVSLHGLELTHDRITNVPGSFNLTTRFLKNAIDYQIPIGIHVIALRENIGMIPNLIYWLKGQGLSDVSILRYVPQGRGLDENIEPPSKDMLHSLYHKLKGENVRFGAPFNFIHKKNIPCKVGYETVMVDVFGNVIPCDSFKDIATNSADNNLSNKNLLEIMSESGLFDYVRKNSMTTCAFECCLGQFLLESQSNNFKAASYA